MTPSPLVAVCLAVGCLALHGSVCQAQEASTRVVVSDIAHFWDAYDAIRATADTAAQRETLDRLFIRRGSPGLHALMQQRDYTAADYLSAIRDYPRFWDTVRPKTLRAGTYAREIGRGEQRLRAIYPALRPARIYFTIGALRSNGTTLDSLVLIGSELALADSSVVTDEIPGQAGENHRRFFDTNPSRYVALLNVHELVHTQQGAFGETLLAVALQEGIAEFVSTLAMNEPSATAAVAFGEAHADAVRSRFASEMFSADWSDWLYNDTLNEFGIRDLGYYVGYAIAERYYDRSEDKGRAVARLIELDHQDPVAVEALVDASHYFDRPVDDLRAAAEASAPMLVGIAEFENGDRDLDPATRRIALTFSAPMNPRFRGFDAGPLGAGHALRIARVDGLSADGRTLTVELAPLVPGKRYQLVVTGMFRDVSGHPLTPALIDVTTGPARVR